MGSPTARPQRSGATLSVMWLVDPKHVKPTLKKSDKIIGVVALVISVALMAVAIAFFSGGIPLDPNLFKQGAKYAFGGIVASFACIPAAVGIYHLIPKRDRVIRGEVPL